MNAEEIFNKVQNLHPSDVYSLADCVLALLSHQETISKALLELDQVESESSNVCLTSGTRNKLRDFLGQ